MRALWTSLEKLDQALMQGTRKWESLRNKDSYRARMEQSVEHVRLPQKAIQFDA